MATTFTARYHTACAGQCDEKIYPGDTIQSVVTLNGLVYAHAHCVDGITTTASDIAMPRGKSAQDKCSKCFQVPASNGVCGCE